jgi:hypothetical protein
MQGRSVSNLAPALACVEALGFRVIPLFRQFPDGSCECGESACQSPGRHELLHIRWATDDADTVRGWWEEWPDSPVGVILHFRPGGQPRWSVLSHLAHSMRKAGFSDTAIEAALAVTNRERCKPPLSERSVQSIARVPRRPTPPKNESWRADLERGLGAA